MSRKIHRIGVYWFPPVALCALIERAWSGALSGQHRVWELIARHSGDCSAWALHATILDAIAILQSDRETFVEAMGSVLRGFPLPLPLPEPQIFRWGNNVFLRWHAAGAFEELRREIKRRAEEFMVVERLDWETVNELDRLLAALGPAAKDDFRAALARLKEQNGQTPLDLIRAPNVGLDWYVGKIASVGGGPFPLTSGDLPFPLSPHVSIASGVRDDDKYGWPAKRVGEVIECELDVLLRAEGLIGPEVTHWLDAAHVVEPGPFAEAIEVTVIDRITSRSRPEYRQRWAAKERLP